MAFMFSIGRGFSGMCRKAISDYLKLAVSILFGWTLESFFKER
jgi:hypothetical protein